MTEFTSGNEYVYQYESQVLTGIPQVSKQYGGLKIQAKAKIDFISSSDAVLQVGIKPTTFCQDKKFNNGCLTTISLPLDHLVQFCSAQVKETFSQYYCTGIIMALAITFLHW